MQFIHFCVNAKHELDETLKFLQCWVLCLRNKLSIPHQCIKISFLFTFNCAKENFSSHKYEVENCNKVAYTFLDINTCSSLKKTKKLQETILCI